MCIVHTRTSYILLCFCLLFYIKGVKLSGVPATFRSFLYPHRTLAMYRRPFISPSPNDMTLETLLKCTSRVSAVHKRPFKVISLSMVCYSKGDHVPLITIRGFKLSVSRCGIPYALHSSGAFPHEISDMKMLSSYCIDCLDRIKVKHLTPYEQRITCF